ncbi:MAG: hypothetical protein A2X12_09615 [Bacteroidetes bacterium GWE2_29_8]|nr:MAG: hypothetical protein A2X12_09615 [Bacteroidetes bacterium GWE2_29_8]
METNHTDVIQLIQSVIDAFNHEAIKKNISMKFDFDVNHENTKTFYFNTDADKLKLMLSNLVSNAIKFNNENGEISLKVSVKKKILSICVIDNGIGISESDKLIIFDRFKKINNNINSINPGHGLGLSIVKAFLEILNGKIDIVSDLNNGSSFFISIPEAEKETSIYNDNNEFDDFKFGEDNIIL